MQAPSVTALGLEAEPRARSVRRDRRAAAAPVRPAAAPLPPLGQRFAAAADAGDLLALKIGAALGGALVGGVAIVQLAPVMIDMLRAAF